MQSMPLDRIRSPDEENRVNTYEGRRASREENQRDVLLPCVRSDTDESLHILVERTNECD